MQQIEAEPGSNESNHSDSPFVLAPELEARDMRGWLRSEEGNLKKIRP